MCFKIEQACTNSEDLVYVSQKNRTGLFYFLEHTIRNLCNKYSLHLFPNGWVGSNSYTIIGTCLYTDGIDITCGIVLLG